MSFLYIMGKVNRLGTIFFKKNLWKNKKNNNKFFFLITFNISDQINIKTFLKLFNDKYLKSTC